VRSVAGPALLGGLDAAAAGAASLPAMLPGSQQRGVSGAVLRWSDATGLETLPAGEYISDLEGEVRRLRETVAAMQRAGEGRNALLEELKAMEPSNLAELTTRAVRACSAPARLPSVSCQHLDDAGRRRAGGDEQLHHATHGAPPSIYAAPVSDCRWS